MGKIFCIGLSKTGTSSLHRAFKMLGLRSCHHETRGHLGAELIQQAKNEGKRFMAYMEQYDAYSDMRLIEVFKELDVQYPGCKFILTDRDPEKWVKSKLAHDERWNISNPNSTPRDTSEYRREWLLEMRERRYREVFEYFGENERLLVMDITLGEGWEKLCPFLGVSRPRRVFPSANKANACFYQRMSSGIKKRFHRVLYSSERQDDV